MVSCAFRQNNPEPLSSHAPFPNTIHHSIWSANHKGQIQPSVLFIFSCLAQDSYPRTIMSPKSPIFLTGLVLLHLLPFRTLDANPRSSGTSKIRKGISNLQVYMVPSTSFRAFTCGLRRGPSLQRYHVCNGTSLDETAASDRD